MYKYCNSGDTSVDTAYATCMYLLESGKEPCEDLKKYIKRMSKSIASRLIATNRNAEAAKLYVLDCLPRQRQRVCMKMLSIMEATILQRI